MEKEQWLSAREMSKRLKLDISTISQKAKSFDIPVDKTLGYNKWRYPFLQTKKVFQNSYPNQNNRHLIDSLIDNTDLQRYNQELHLTGDWIVTGDAHIPFHDPYAFQQMLQIAQRMKIRKILLAGDTFELDTFKKYLDHHDQVNWAYEKEAGANALKYLNNNFDEIVLLIGNHELRLWKRLEGLGDQKDVFIIMLHSLKESRKIKESLYPYCVINESWLAIHPKSYSSLQARNPYFLASKYMIDLIEKGKSPNRQYGLIAFHGHLGGEGTDVSSRFQVADGMGLFDPDLFSYYKKKITTGPKWRKGFLAIKNNYLYRFPISNTDWNFWLNVHK